MKRNKWMVGSLATLIFATSWNVQLLYARDQAGSQSPGERSKELSRERIEQEATQAEKQFKIRPVAEALSAVQETRAAIKALDENRPDAAKTALERAAGKTDIVLANHPNVALIPFSLDVRIVDTSADDATLKRVTGEARELVNNGRYQPARWLLRGLASEIVATTVNIPIASYPDAIKSASRLIDQNKPKEAKSKLVEALHTLVLVDTVVPLPVVRAQALIDEAVRMTEDRKTDKGQVTQLLNDAERQLTRAEQLGYGNRKQDFAELQTAIKNVREAANKDQEIKNLLLEIKENLKSLKEKLAKNPSPQANPSPSS